MKKKTEEVLQFLKCSQRNSFEFHRKILGNYRPNNFIVNKWTTYYLLN